MFVIEFAGLKVLINNKYGFVRSVCSDYITSCMDYDFSVEVPENEIENEKLISGSFVQDGFAESVCIYRAIAEQLPKYDAFVLHGAAIKIDSNGYIFSAQSGVGKTTHVMNWKKAFAERVTVVNGDKPVIRFFDGIPYVCGTPWSGKEDMNSNTKANLKGICFVERSSDNSIDELQTDVALKLILKQVFFPVNEANKIKTLELLDRAFKHIKCWKLYCNSNENSAITAYKKMIEED